MQTRTLLVTDDGASIDILPADYLPEVGVSEFIGLDTTTKKHSDAVSNHIDSSIVKEEFVKDA